MIRLSLLGMSLRKNSVAVDKGLLFQNHSRRASSSSSLLWNRRRRIVTRRISKLSSSIRVESAYATQVLGQPVR